MKKITRMAFALFLGIVIVHEPEAIENIITGALEVFSKEAAKIEAKKEND